ncbi:MAG TPA: lysophospholipid acyltransferase family protein [Gemmatimonadales bacterium]|nr:lysophospholipid acyltransferase family protein [Gemmatimonadales bacterium]
MARLYITIVSVWVWFVLGACLLLWLPLLALVRLVTLPFDKGRYWTGYLFRQIGPVTATLNPLWRFRVTGTMPANPRQPFVAVSNHESFVDILLISHLPWEMKWLSKVEILRIPVLGWNMRLAGDVPVERGTAKSAVKAMRRCREIMEQDHISVIIFPEGTRSTTSELLPFKDGAFRLAIDAQVPILPLVVRGTGTALPKHGWRFGRSEAEVRVLEPIPTTGLTTAEVPALRDRVRDLIIRTRDEMRLAAGQKPDSPAPGGQ